MPPAATGETAAAPQETTAAGCGGGGGDSGKVVFSWVPDDSGTIQKLINKFNEQNKGKFQVAYREINLQTQEYFDRLKTELQAGSTETDVFGGDVPWTAELAENGWIADVSTRFPEAERSEFLISEERRVGKECRSRWSP